MKENKESPAPKDYNEHHYAFSIKEKDILTQIELPKTDSITWYEPSSTIVDLTEKKEEVITSDNIQNNSCKQKMRKIFPSKKR